MGWQWHQLDQMQSFAPHSRQITTPVPHHSFFMGRMLFLTPNQQCQSTEGNVSLISDKTQNSDAKKVKGKKPCKSLAKNEGKSLSARKGKNVAPKTVLKSKKKNATSAAGGPSRATSLCLYCREADDITKLVQCQKCEMWAHWMRRSWWHIFQLVVWILRVTVCFFDLVMADEDMCYFSSFLLFCHCFAVERY